jgi:NAD(P)-dependent dehydrogenase (short-subunit alcohol dehydrogenase family)
MDGDGSALLASQFLAWRRGLLASTGGASHDLDWLLDLGGGLRWPELQALHLHPARMVRLSQPLAQLEELWRRHRRTSEPLQYLVGLCPWRDLELRVGPGVLIPRQETELLVDLALALAPSTPGAAGLRWADLGTGCGALAVALARALPAGQGLAADISEAALAFAALNRAAAGVEERFILMRSDWWEGLRPWWGGLELVVANAGISGGTGNGRPESEAQARAIFDVNLGGVLNTVLPALAAMQAQPEAVDGWRGRIAVVSSVAAFVPAPGAPAYCASKAAVDAWTVGTAAMARRQGVLMTSVCPGYVRTAMTARNRFPMPGLMGAERAAGIILRGLVRGTRRIVFPWWMGLAARIVGLLPLALSTRLLNTVPGKDGL